MTAIEIARQLAALGQAEGAVRAYGIALHQGGLAQEERLEAAVYLLQGGGDYRVAYTQLYDLYNEGCAPDDCLGIMTEAFYAPNVKQQKTRYEKNCEALARYPYLFRKDFPKFEELPLLFYPFSGNGYLPLDPQKRQFGAYVDFSRPVVSRNFFKNLDDPILATDVYSQYELEYLNDNVRPSEDIGRENHLYLHYTGWETFCAHLQVLNVRRLLEDKKIVFLFEDELSLYPIDFKERYGIDYSQYPVKKIRPQDIHRLIWHTQLSSDNGGDFFNEVFDNHPNLLFMPSLMIEQLEETLKQYRGELEKADQMRASGLDLTFASENLAQLYLSPSHGDKDVLASLFLDQTEFIGGMDHGARIAPALFFQPHFSNMVYTMNCDEKGRTVLLSEQYEYVRNSPIFKGFKYIKTFTPLRRFTTSYAATIRWQAEQRGHIKEENGKRLTIGNLPVDRVTNRSFMIDSEDRLYKDSVLVRFEDGKTNPEATFRALAAFLDLPYTESMTYCSEKGVRDVETAAGNVVGFDTATVYRTYDEYATDEERAYIEFCLRDAYEFYGYDLHYYDGGPVDEARVKEWLKGFTIINSRIEASWLNNVFADASVYKNGEPLEAEEMEAFRRSAVDKVRADNDAMRLRIANLLIKGLYFVNKRGQPLRMMPKLKLDPALLKEPLYH